MFARNISNLKFGDLKTDIGVLRKIARDEGCEAAYRKLLRRAQSEDILLKSYKEGGVIVTKLTPLEQDTVELSKSKDFITGIEEAIEKLEEEKKSLAEQTSGYIDLNRLRLMGL